MPSPSWLVNIFPEWHRPAAPACSEKGCEREEALALCPRDDARHSKDVSQEGCAGEFKEGLKSPCCHQAKKWLLVQMAGTLVSWLGALTRPCLSVSESQRQQLTHSVLEAGERWEDLVPCVLATFPGSLLCPTA